MSVALEHVSIFQDCDESTLKSLTSYLKPTEFRSGSFIVRHGELAKDMFFISKGAVSTNFTAVFQLNKVTTPRHFLPFLKNWCFSSLSVSLASQQWFHKQDSLLWSLKKESTVAVARVIHLNIVTVTRE